MNRIAPLLAVGLLWGCGARPTPAPSHAPMAEAPPPVDLAVQDDGLHLHFQRVDAEEAQRQVMRCQLTGDEDNPRLAGAICPVDLGLAQIEVAEGPAGVTIMIRVGAKPAEALRAWYAENLR